MRILICGGRDFADMPMLYRAMQCVPRPSLIIEGGARGADRLGREWTLENGVPYVTFMADWDRDGKRAGPIRNQRMLEEGKPDLVLAMPGGRGTADMVRRARGTGVPAATNRGELLSEIARLTAQGEV